MRPTPGPNPLAAGEDNISVDAAQATILSALRPIGDTEVVALTQAIGRVNARDVISPIDVSAHDNGSVKNLGVSFVGA